jgi:23S rRNA (uracil1939-C5)-methyltransferase
MRLKIEKLIYGGSGLARTDEGVVFVPRTAAGDVIEAVIVEKKKDYSVARITEILDPSPDRQEPMCIAGCCHWQHIRYDRQVEYKEAIIRESVQRLAYLEWNNPIERIIGPDKNYRQRATFHVVEGRLGFMQENTNTVVPIQKCESLVPELNEFIRSTDPGGAREIHAISAPEVAATFVFENGNVKRLGHATIHVDDLRYKVNPETFFQANRFLLSPFIHEVLHQAGASPMNILELYSGVGFFSIPLSRISQELIGIEANRSAVRQAQANAQFNGRRNVRFFEGHVDATLKRGAFLKPDVVVLNPPRSGCGVRTAEQIAGFKPHRIVYVSCNPTTFAREAKVFVERGYQISRITFVDQFPNTYHIEMVVLFEVK